MADEDLESLIGECLAGISDGKYPDVPRDLGHRLLERLNAEGLVVVPPLTPWEVYNAVVRGYAQAENWKGSTWKGKLVAGSPADLWAFAEIVHEVRPTVVFCYVEGDDDGVSDFFGDLLDGIEQGRVWRVGPPLKSESRRIRYWDDLDDVFIQASTTRLQGVVVYARFDSEDAAWLDDMLGKLASLVPVGGFLLVPGTVAALDPTACHAVPEAVERFLEANAGVFMADPMRERHGLTLMSGGFIRKIA